MSETQKMLEYEGVEYYLDDFANSVAKRLMTITRVPSSPDWYDTFENGQRLIALIRFLILDAQQPQPNEDEQP